MESRLARAEISVEFDPPHRTRPKLMLLRARVPDGWKIISANADEKTFNPDPSGAVDISSLMTKKTIVFHTQRCNN
jgi:5,10-methylenetetrahydrofolate reductase